MILRLVLLLVEVQNNRTYHPSNSQQQLNTIHELSLNMSAELKTQTKATAYSNAVRSSCAL